MGDKRKATDDDIPGAGTETTAVDDTSQAPAEPTATAAGSLQPLPGPAGAPIQFLRGGRGGGSGHGGFSQSAPMTMLEQPLRNQGSPRAAPTAGAGDTAARVSSATVTAAGPPDAWHGGFAPPLGNPAYTGESSTSHAPAAYATRPPSLPALGHGRGGNPVTVTSLRDASRRRLLARRQPGNASAPQAQGIPIPSNAGAPQGQEAIPDMEKEAVLDIEQGVLDELESSIQRPDIDFCLLCPKPLETQTVLVVEGEDPKWICEDCEADLQQAPDPVLEPQGQGAVPVNVDGVFYDRAALEQHQAIWARLQVELEMAAIRTKERHRGGPPPPPPPPPPGGVC
ncbi:uncharacterized protein [Triticum aestivum]|uniref:uncharacterized protein n=1 Tax=Triticum aestivum TaxID=4565 RepID=UPI001D0330B7|nr:uncharacterized protein LOC123125897 [Triticum aestivum]XP_044446846.1 uncharacterized protein LOC123176884 [Triticum aestivum]